MVKKIPSKQWHSKFGALFSRSPKTTSSSFPAPKNQRLTIRLPELPFPDSELLIRSPRDSSTSWSRLVLAMTVSVYPTPYSPLRKRLEPMHRSSPSAMIAILKILIGNANTFFKTHLLYRSNHRSILYIYQIQT